MLKRILMSIAECPFSPTSGAGRSMRGVCELLAARGFDVYAVCTTASELAFNPADLELHGITPYRSIRGPVKDIAFEHRSVRYWMLDTGDKTIRNWRNAGSVADFDTIFDQALQSVAPHALLTLGGLPEECARQDRARATGAKIIFSVRNYEYQQPRFFHERQFDGVFTGSQFLTDFYKRKIGLDSVALPLPMILEDVVCDHHEPTFFTFVNPKRDKGAVFMARVISETGKARPDIRFQIVESESFCCPKTFDAATLGNVHVIKATANPKDYLRSTKVLLSPALWEEPAGRTIPEALMNGIPVITSGRGGLPEVAHGIGFIVPINPKITPATNEVSASDVEQWVALIIRLQDEPTKLYTWASSTAWEMGQHYHPDILGPIYTGYFDWILAGKPAGLSEILGVSGQEAAKQEASC